MTCKAITSTKIKIYGIHRYESYLSVSTKASKLSFKSMAALNGINHLKKKE